MSFTTRLSFQQHAGQIRTHQERNNKLHYNLISGFHSFTVCAVFSCPGGILIHLSNVVTSPRSVNWDFVNDENKQLFVWLTDRMWCHWWCLVSCCCGGDGLTPPLPPGGAWYCSAASTPAHSTQYRVSLQYYSTSASRSCSGTLTDTPVSDDDDVCFVVWCDEYKSVKCLRNKEIWYLRPQISCFHAVYPPIRELLLQRHKVIRQ